MTLYGPKINANAMQKPSHVFRHALRHDLVFYALSSESVFQVSLPDFLAISLCSSFHVNRVSLPVVLIF